MERLKNKKIIFNKTMAVLILAIIILPTIAAITAKAQTQDNSYTVLAPLPGIGQNTNNTTTLQDYIPAVFNLLIGLSAVAAVVNIVIGGFVYMSANAIMGKASGKDRIMNSIYALVLVISAWLILYTINPNLLKLNLNIDSVEVKQNGGGTLETGGSSGSW
jgi:hypothetical protein